MLSLLFSSLPLSRAQSKTPCRRAHALPSVPLSSPYVARVPLALSVRPLPHRSKERREYERMPERQRRRARAVLKRERRKLPAAGGPSGRAGGRSVGRSVSRVRARERGRSVCAREGIGGTLGGKGTRARVRSGGRRRRTEGEATRESERRGAVAMATRRGGNATVTMAAAGYSLSDPTCLSPSPPPRPPRPLLSAPAADGPSSFRPRTVSRRETTDPQRERGRWSAALRRNVLLPFRLFLSAPRLLF